MANSVTIPELQALTASNTINGNDLFIVYKVNAPSSEKTRKVTALKLKEYLQAEVTGDISRNSVFDLKDVQSTTEIIPTGAILEYNNGVFKNTTRSLSDIIADSVGESSSLQIYADYSLLPNPSTNGSTAFVVDASSDPTVNKSVWALYVYNNVWVNIAREDDMVFTSNLSSSLAIPNNWQDEVVGLTIADFQGLTSTERDELIFFPTVDPTISVNKSVTLSGITTQTVEVNTIITSVTTATFNPGEIENGNGTIGPDLVGSANQYRFLLPNSTTDVTINTTNSSQTHTFTGYAVQLGDNRWEVEVDHDAGTGVYTDNKSNDSTVLDTSRILGTVSDLSNNITGSYILFYGSTATNSTNSSDIRALPNSRFRTAGNSFSFTTGTVNNIIEIALPPGVNLISVTDNTTLPVDITSSFVNTGIVAVNTANGSGASVNYNLYRLTNAIPYNPSATFDVIIS